MQGSLDILINKPTSLTFKSAVSGLPYCQGIGGVLVRLTTCKILTNSLPNLSYIAPPPPRKRRDSRPAGFSGGPVNAQAVSFPGKSLKRFIIADGGI